MIIRLLAVGTFHQVLVAHKLNRFWSTYHKWNDIDISLEFFYDSSQDQSWLSDYGFIYIFLVDLKKKSEWNYTSQYYGEKLHICNYDNIAYWIPVIKMISIRSDPDPYDSSQNISSRH